MADFSASTLRDLPATTAESLQRGDPRVLGWLREWIEEGDLINRTDPSYDLIEHAQKYIVGEQITVEQKRLKYIPQVIVNETRKAMQAHVSTLTDFQPAAGWKSLNPYAIAEYVTCLHDLDIGDTEKYALAGGTGDMVIDWDPHAPLGGQHQLSARDPRDTLPL